MDPILVKIFATALTLSEVVTQPQAVKTHFDPLNGPDDVVQILRPSDPVFILNSGAWSRAAYHQFCKDASCGAQPLRCKVRPSAPT